MTTFEQTLLREISTLPESRQADVLAFIRFLKISLPNEEKISKDFKEALQDARATAEENNITQAEIDAEIRAVRDGRDLTMSNRSMTTSVGMRMSHAFSMPP